MKQKKSKLEDVLVLLVLLLGLASVAFGAWLIYPPAGFIVGGVETAALAILTMIGGSLDETGQRT